MKFLAVVVGVILAAFALKLVLAVAFTVLHFVLLLAFAAALVLGAFGLYKLVMAPDEDDRSSSGRTD